MPFGIGRDADLERRNGADAPHQFGRALITVGMRAIGLTQLGHVAAQSDDVAYARLPIVADDGVHRLARRADAGQMGGWLQRRFIDDALHGRMCAVAR